MRCWPLNRWVKTFARVVRPPPDTSPVIPAVASTRPLQRLISGRSSPTLHFRAPSCSPTVWPSVATSPVAVRALRDHHQIHNHRPRCRCRTTRSRSKSTSNCTGSHWTDATASHPGALSATNECMNEVELIMFTCCNPKSTGEINSHRSPSVTGIYRFPFCHPPRNGLWALLLLLSLALYRDNGNSFGS